MVRFLILFTLVVGVHSLLIQPSLSKSILIRGGYEEDEEPKEDRSVGRMQFMITQKMRRVLIQELNYLASEVDMMEPQIASVVIERGLTRPARGMPASWRRSGGNYDRKGRAPFFVPILKAS